MHRFKRSFLINTILTMIFIVASALPVTADIRIANHQDGSTVRYPVIQLRGTIDGVAGELSVRVAGDTAVSTVVRSADRFKALVELRPGANLVELSTPEERHTIEISYQPQTNPYYVRLIWMTDSGGDTRFAAPTDDVPQEYAQRLRTAAQLMQTFTAERMHDLGFGHRTFRLERDKDGEVVVHTLKAPKAADYYYGIPDRSWWTETYRWLNRAHDDPYAKNIVLAAFTRKDSETGKMMAHTALGGGNLGLFGSASVFSWPRSIRGAVGVFEDATRVDAANVHDDSAGRNTYWGLASTTIGATLHEMGHTFGLPHCTDGMGIMTRGFDHFNRFFTLSEPPSGRNRRQRSFTPGEEAYFAPISASYLRWSPWFQLDKPRSAGDDIPQISIDRDADTVVISSKTGVAWVGFWVGSDVHSYREYWSQLPNRVEFSFAEIREILGGRDISEISTISANGRAQRVRVKR